LENTIYCKQTTLYCITVYYEGTQHAVWFIDSCWFKLIFASPLAVFLLLLLLL